MSGRGAGRGAPTEVAGRVERAQWADSEALGYSQV